MIEGVIQGGTPLVTMRVLGTRGREATIASLLDTGFDGFLCLPIPVAASLGLELLEVTETELADGTLGEDDLIFSAKQRGMARSWRLTSC
jgi:predicted aspartyl protease